MALLDGVGKTNGYMSSILGGSKPQDQGATVSAFSGRSDDSLQQTLEKNSIHVAANNR